MAISEGVMVSVVIPTLGRPESLETCVRAICTRAEYYPFEIIIEHDSFANRHGAPKTLKLGVARSAGELVMFLGDDCVPRQYFMRNAVTAMAEHFPEMDGMIGLNDQFWGKDDDPTHWLASKKLLPALDGEFFHTGYHHVGCDNELARRVRKMGKYHWEESAKIEHRHPVLTGWDKLDETYKLAWRDDLVSEDRALLARRIEELGL